jgi:histidyl-tRNA synthetase
MKPLPPKGTRDHLPMQVRTRADVIATVKRVFESFGYAPLETPAVERLDVLTGKYGDEADRLIFRILKRGAAGERGEADLGLRYDLTVPLARVMAANQDLPKPFKRYQIQPVWRAERPQKGRFREFVQCDVDCVGTASVLADAEMVAVMHETLAALAFRDYRISINHRKILSAFMDYAGVPAEFKFAAIRAMDKLDKVGRDGVEAELASSDIPKPAADEIMGVMFDPKNSGRIDYYLNAAQAFAGEYDEGRAGVAEMRDLAEYLTYAGVPDDVLSFDLHMARGLDYYTGPIYEAFVAEGGVGSVGGGGRYDRLIAQLGGPDLPATGTSFGLERIITLLAEREAAGAAAAADVLVAVYDESVLQDALKVAAEIRATGAACEVYLDPSAKLAKQFSYADAKGIPFVVVVGPDEVTKGVVQLKNLAKREQMEVPRAEAAAAVAKTLERK